MRLKKELINKVFSLVMALSMCFLIGGCGKISSLSQSSIEWCVSFFNKDSKKDNGVSSKNDFKFIGNRDSGQPESVARSIELKQNRTYADFIDLGTCYLWTGRFQNAAECYEMAARISESKEQLVGALYNKAGALVYVNIKKSLDALDLACRLQPDNLELARLRVLLNNKSNDALGSVVAFDHLAKIDPGVTGHEVMDPVTGTVIITLIIVSSLTLSTVTVYALTPPNDRKEVVVPLMAGYSSVCGALIPEKSGITLFSKLAEAK